MFTVGQATFTIVIKGEDECRRMSAKAPDEAAQGQGSWDLPWSIPEPAALCEIWAIQGSEKGWLENSACLGVKNIGKPCSLIAYARFHEGGTGASLSSTLPVFLCLGL